MRRLGWLVWHLPDVLCGVLMVAVSLLLFATVIFRYCLHVPLGWSEEGARLLFIWLTFLGAAVCARRKGHTGFAVLVAGRAAPVRRRFALLALGAIVSFSALLIVQGWRVVERTTVEQFVMLGVPLAWAYASIPVFGAYTIAYMAPLLWAEWRGTGRWFDGSGPA